MVEITARTKDADILGTWAGVIALLRNRDRIRRITTLTPVRRRLLSVDALIVITRRYRTCFAIVALVIDEDRFVGITTRWRFTRHVDGVKYALVIDAGIGCAGIFVVAISSRVATCGVDDISAEAKVCAIDRLLIDARIHRTIIGVGAWIRCVIHFTTVRVIRHVGAGVLTGAEIISAGKIIIAL